jgi:hypothetical protein
MNDDWPFGDPKNVAVITVRQIVREGKPILRVSHDEDDGGWQFLEWGTPRMEDAMVLALEEIVAIDPSVCELTDLPYGWRATRRSPSEPWQREPKLEVEE